jgi:branched-chain amino acid transport system ATP-binding protein
MEYFQVTNITKTFGGVTALEDLSFVVKKGEVFSIIGPNGAGKPTLFNCINSIYTPETGTVLFKGEKITHLKSHEIATLGIARTFQNIELFSGMTTLDNLMLGRHIHTQTGLLSAATMLWRGLKASQKELQQRKKVEEIIDFLDLQGARDKLISQLPYGTQKIIELGRALCLEPEVLLLDEPAAGLTREERDDLLYWIRDIRDEFDITILMIEHNMQMVMDISDRIMAINFGKKLVEGTADEVVNHPEVVKAYLGE